MRVLLINESDRNGGAGRAMYRLHEALLMQGIDSKILTLTKTTSDTRVQLFIPSKFMSFTRRIWKTVFRLVSRVFRIVDNQLFEDYHDYRKVLKVINEISPDIIHLHWFTNNFFGLSLIKRFRVPIVWTLHDMWALTGGCFYDQGCGRFENSCGKCPILRGHRKKDPSYRNWIQKKRLYEGNKNITFIAPSTWMHDLTFRSSLLRNKPVLVIPNGINKAIYKKTDKNFARKALNLPEDEKIILFGAAGGTKNNRKGFDLLEQAIINRNGMEISLAVFGNSEKLDPKFFPIPLYDFGLLRDDISLVLLYNSADIMVVPSRQENLANTIVEALACRTPVLAFNIGGNHDLIRHKINGYLAEPFIPESLWEGITFLLERHKNQMEMDSIHGINFLSELFSYDSLAQSHIDLYNKMLLRS